MPIDKILYFEIAIISLFVLFVMRIKDTNMKTRGLSHSLFRAMGDVVGIFVVSDAVVWVLQGTDFFGSYAIQRVNLIIYHLAALVLYLLWNAYMQAELGIIKKITRGKLIICGLSILFFLLFMIIDIKTGLYFQIDENNMFRAGKFYFLSLPVVFCVLIYNCFKLAMIKRNKDSLGSKGVSKFFYFLAPLLFAAIIQSILGRISLLPIASVISTLLVYVMSQNYLLSVDTLTGVYNRRAALVKFNDCIKREGPGKKLFFIIVDVDNFKGINDKYGHVVGDKALVRVAEAMKRVYCSSDCIARLGGDEFCIMGHRKSESDIKDLMNKISLELEQIECNCTDMRFPIYVSMGYALYRKNHADSMDKLIEEADKFMYDNKKKRRLIAAGNNQVHE